MKRIAIVLMLGAAVALTPACDKAGRHESGKAAKVDTAADEQAIRSANHRWLELVRAKDAAAIAQLYAEDGALMVPNMPIARGREAVQKAWADLMAMPGFDLTFATEQLVVSGSGDMAMDRGTYRFTATPEGQAYQDSGKALVVWRKVGNEWKVAADIFNSDKPATES